MKLLNFWSKLKANTPDTISEKWIPKAEQTAGTEVIFVLDGKSLKINFLETILKKFYKMIKNIFEKLQLKFDKNFLDDLMKLLMLDVVIYKFMHLILKLLKIVRCGFKNII